MNYRSSNKINSLFWSFCVCTNRKKNYTPMTTVMQESSEKASTPSCTTTSARPTYVSTPMFEEWAPSTWAALVERSKTKHPEEFSVFRDRLYRDYIFRSTRRIDMFADSKQSHARWVQEMHDRVRETLSETTDVCTNKNQ